MSNTWYYCSLDNIGKWEVWGSVGSAIYVQFVTEQSFFLSMRLYRECERVYCLVKKIDSHSIKKRDHISMDS